MRGRFLPAQVAPTGNCPSSAPTARAILEKSGLRTGQVSGVFAHGATALMKPDDPFAAENRRLSILAVRRGMEKVAARGQDFEADGEPQATPKPGAERSTTGKQAAKPEPTAD